MEVTAIIPNWNGAVRLDSILADLKEQTQPVRELIVVDNGSTDNSAELAERHGARVIRLDSNRGFAVAVNRGVRESRTSWTAIVNNDVRLPVDWIAKLLHAAVAVNKPFAVGKTLSLGEKSRVDGTFDAICRGGCAWRCGQGRVDGPIWSEPRDISFPPFTALLIRREFFVELQGLDEFFGSYLEDVDFGLRCASNGYTGRYVPDAIAYHEGSATLGQWSRSTVRQIARNQILLLARHYPTSLLLRFGWPIAVSHLLWGLVALKHGAGLAWFMGKIDGLRLFASCRRREGGQIAAILGSSEKEILDLQRRTGWDWYWRVYFALT